MRIFTTIILTAVCLILSGVSFAQCDVAQHTGVVNQTIVTHLQEENNMIIWRGMDETTFQIFQKEADSPTYLISNQGTKNNSSPNLSEDGSTVVWTGEDQNGVFQIYRFQNNRITKVSTQSSEGNFGPKVNDDGSVIVWRSYTTANNLNIYKSVNGGAPVQVSDETSFDNDNAEVSPDGLVIAYIGHTDDGPKVFMVNQNSDPVIISEVRGEINPNLHISNNGNVIIWRDELFGTSHVFGYFNGSEKVLLSEESTNNRTARLNYEGTVVTWIGEMNGVKNAFAYNVQSKRDEIISAASVQFKELLSLSSDGNHMVWVENGNTIVVKNDDDDPKVLHVTTFFITQITISDDGMTIFWTEKDANDIKDIHTLTQCNSVVVNAVPTMSQWGLYMLFLLFMSFGIASIFAKQQRKRTALAC